MQTANNPTATDNAAADVDLEGTPVPSISDLFVDHRTLPMPPMAVLEIMRRADDPDVSLPEIVSLVESEVSIAVQVLRMANSALYSPSKEITTIGRAMTTLGLRTIRLLALTTSLRALMPQTCEGIEMAEIRQRMVMNGALARAVSAQTDVSVREEAFLAGLLTGIGPVVLASRAPEVCRSLTALDGQWPSPDREREVLGYTTDDVTSALIDEWGLPNVFGETIRRRNDDIAADDSALLVCLKAALLAERVLTRRDAGEALPALRAGLQDASGLPGDEVDRWLVETEPLVAETAELMQFRMPPDLGYEELLGEATDRIHALQASMDRELFRVHESAGELARRNDELELEAATDSLTQLPNRRAFDGRLREILAAITPLRPGSPVDRNGRGLGVLMIDLDRFKSINDSHGHGVGDDVLRLVGAVLQEQTRGADFAARLGGEEFVMLIPDTSRESLFAMAERLRLAIATLALPLDTGGVVTVTASIGGALIDDGSTGWSARDLLDLADRQLYAAKQQGRNCTSVG